ncbi:MAG TPA: GYF domain-containing protein [Planctomycetaceae bacterium]
MSTTYYLRSRGKVLGPFPLDRLQVMKSRGQLGRTHQVSTDRQTWVAAGALPELFAAPPGPASFDSADIEPAESSAGVGTPSAQTNGPATPAAAWFYHVGGQQFGPTSAAELRRMLSTGGLASSDMVWREGMESWVAIGDVPELSVASRQIAAGATDASRRRRRSATAVTALCLGLAPWCLYTLGFIGLLLVEVAVRNQKPWEDGDLLFLALGGGIYALFLGFTWFVMSGLAIVFGGVGLAQISASEGRIYGQGMAVAGLVLGIANILLIFLWIPLRLALVTN